MDHFDVPVRLTFVAGGTGSTVVEDFGVPEDGGAALPLTWSTSAGTLTVQVEGEDAVTVGYAVSGDTLSLTLTEPGETSVLSYARQ
jgi:hypothetical protein